MPTLANEENTFNIPEDVLDAIYQQFDEKYHTILVIDLTKNTCVPYRLEHFVKQRYERRFKENNDYRQIMLSYVLSSVDKYEKEPIIQRMLPERLMTYLSKYETFSDNFHEIRNGLPICHHAKIIKNGKNLNKVLLGICDIDENVKIIQDYVAGTNNIMLITKKDETFFNEAFNDQYSLIFTENEAEALNILSHHYYKISLLIVDSTTISEDATKIVEKVVEEYKYKDIPIVVLIDGGSIETQEQYINIGAKEVISLPCYKTLINNRVSSLISLRDTKTSLEIASKDTLTGLLTREAFYRYSTKEINISPKKSFYIAIVDIENFAMYQEKYSDAIGDIIIKYVANQINALVPGVLVCGRYSEESFSLLIEKHESFDDKQVVNEIRKYAPVANLEVKIGTTNVRNDTPINVLCDQAYAALTRIKQTYGVNYIEYDESIHLEQIKEQKILSSMENALENNQFSVYYQPKHSAIDGTVLGAEALVRWEHPEYGFMNPAEFLPIFEKVGFIRGLDRYIWRKALIDLKRWEHLGLPKLFLSLNLSRRDFEQDDLADWIINLTKEIGVDPKNINIELTESIFSDNPNKIASIIHQLHEAGFAIELDDFGVGYSYITTFNNMDIDVLKIDKSIIQSDVPGSKRNVLDFCIQLAKMMKLKTVIEGVETEAQLKRARDCGVDIIQGFYYSKPISLEEFEEYLVKHTAK